MEVFKNHPNMILKEEHFASLKINWNDKVMNLREISQEINSLDDSQVLKIQEIQIEMDKKSTQFLDNDSEIYLKEGNYNQALENFLDLP